MRFSLTLSLSIACLGVVRTTFAQDVLFVTDAGRDRVVRCLDVNGNGNLNELGDIIIFYDGVTGSVPLSNNVGICNGPGGTQYVCDTSTDVVLALTDLNADGDALDASEAVIFFDGRAGGNAHGILMGAANCMHFRPATNKLWIASASQGTALIDEILVVGDNTADGDANDLGELVQYWTAPTAAYLPQAVLLDPTGRVFVTEIGSVVPKGVYELIDVNNDGDAQDAGEHVPYFLLPITTPVPFAWSLEQDAQGWFYVGDTGNDIVFRFKDLNNDGDAHDAGESGNFFVPGIASTIWDTAATPCGTIYASDGLSPDRIYRLIDANNDGVIGAGEATEMYIETGGNPIDISNGRGIAVRSAPCGTPSTPFCFGDGTGTACPCANSGALGNGCANSSFAAGAKLAASGIAGASAGTDTLVLTASNIPGPGLFFQGAGQFAGGLGIAFGDGLLCAGGAILRMGVVFPTGSSASYPGGLTPNPIHGAGTTTAGDVRHYQCWYRDAPVFCTADTYNLTQGLTLTWGP